MNRKEILDKRIVFNTVRNLRNVVDKEFFLAKLLALNGAKVIILLDDGILKHWDTITISNISKYSKFNEKNLNPYFVRFFLNFYFIQDLLEKNIFNRSLKSYSDENFKIMYYSEVFNHKVKEVNADRRLLEILEKFAQSSTIRFFQTSDLNFKNKSVKKYFNLSLKNALISYKIGEFVAKKVKPDYFVTSHGIYSTWGPAFEYMRDKEIKCRVFAGVHGHALDINKVFFADHKIQLLTRSKFWKEFKKTPLSPIMRKKVRDYMKQRTNYSSRDAKKLYDGKKNIFKVRKNYGYRYHIAMFPHLIWDGNIKDRHQVFNGYIDWFMSTIDFLKNRKNTKLYIKSHPAELKFKKSNRISEIIGKRIDFKKINNIEIIPPEQKIDTYTFIRSGIDLGIVYDGFLGIELPYLKVPTITCVPKGFASIENGNITITSKKHYFDLLNNIENTIQIFKENYKERRNNIIRYLYWYIFKNAVDLPSVSFIKSFKKKNLDKIFDKKLLNLFE